MRRCFKLNSALALGAAMLLWAGAASAAPAVIGSSQWPNVWTNSPIPATIAASTTQSLVGSNQLTIVSGYDYGVELLFTNTGTAGSASSTSSTITVNVNVAMDGTNYPTSPILPFSTTITGAGAQTRVYTNFPANCFSSGAAIRVESIKNGDTNTLNLGRLILGHAKKPLVFPNI